jgi:type II secretory pathway component PulK
MMALLVASMIGASMLRTSALSMQQMQREQKQLQASLLTDAGYQRALAGLRRDRTPREEEWIVRVDPNLPSSEGVVQIAIKRAPNGEQWQITVVTVYPQESAQRIQITREWNVAPPIDKQ